MQKLENEDPAEMEKSKEKQKEFEMMKDAIWKEMDKIQEVLTACYGCLLYTSPSPRDKRQSRMPSSA